MSEETSFWNSEQSTAPGLSRDRIRKWEAQQGVQLPKILREAYREHNGGVLLSSSLELYPLEQVVAPGQAFWSGLRVSQIDADAFEDRSKLLVIGWDNEAGGQYYLNYNDCLDDGEPSLWSYLADGSDINRISRSTTKFLKKLTAVSSHPEVDWAEAARMEVLADETIDESSWLPPGTVSRYLLARGEELVILFREGLNLETGTRCLCRIALPLPLDGSAMRVRQRKGGGPWGIQLLPTQPDGIVCIESTELPAGGWRSRRLIGLPKSEIFECESRERLEELRVELLGERAAAQFPGDPLIEETPAEADESTAEELQILGDQLLRVMQEHLPEFVEKGHNSPPADALEHIRHLHHQLRAEIANRTEGGPVSADLTELVEEVQRRLDTLGE